MIDKYAIAIFLIALAIASAAVFLDPVRWWDETVYGSLGWNLHNNPFDYSFNKFDDNSKDYPGQAGFRAPLLPYMISVAYSISENFPVEFIVPLFSALGSVALYFLCLQFFSRKVSAFAALLLAIIPMHAYYSGKIMTDVFSTTVATFTILAFWIGFEKGSNKVKIVTGALLALTILARYTWIWLPAALFLYLLIRDRNLKFIDRYFVFSAFVFFVVLLPWFWYGQEVYGTPLGPILHASKAVTYWGGLQPWNFYFTYFPQMFSLGIAAAGTIGLFFMLKNRDNFTLLVLLWIAFSLAVAMVSPHKEDRFLMSLTPALAIAATVGISSIKKYFVPISLIVILIAALTLGASFYYTMKTSYRTDSQCYIDAMKFLQGIENNAVVLTVNSPVVYFYTHKETAYAPQDQSELKQKAAQYDKPVYYLASKYDGAKDFRLGKEPSGGCAGSVSIAKLG